MKKNILLLLILNILIISGCYTQRYMIKSFEIGQEIQSNIGNPMIIFEYFSGNAGFRQELIYSGINNNLISILYREYFINIKGTFIKEGYTNQAIYDLNLGDDITYRDTKLKIIFADNNIIRFIVTESKAGELQSPTKPN